MATDNVLKQVREYFGMDLKTFRTEWTKLSTESKEQIKQGIVDGTLNY